MLKKHKRKNNQNKNYYKYLNIKSYYKKNKLTLLIF
jgi:hypothetical protein